MRCVFGARQVFETTFGHTQTFVFDRFFILFLIHSKNALVKMGLAPPSSWSCRHFFVGTVRKIAGEMKNEKKNDFLCLKSQKLKK